MSQSKRAKYRRQVKRGLITLIIGVVLTVIAYSIAATGGKYVVFVGAILVGIFELLSGLIGLASTKGQTESLGEESAEDGVSEETALDPRDPGYRIRQYAKMVMAGLFVCAGILLGISIMVGSKDNANKIFGLVILILIALGLAKTYSQYRDFIFGRNNQVVCGNCSATLKIKKDSAQSVLICPQCGKPIV